MKPDSPELRRIWISYQKRVDAHDKAMEAHPLRYTRLEPKRPQFPDELRGLNCGAKTRKGTPCQLTELYGNGRCRWHAGLSTGPITDAGKEQCRINGRKGGRPRKPNSKNLIKPEI